jgi:hypothetical protein
MQFESEPSGIGTYRSATVGDYLREALATQWPKEPVQVCPVERDGLSMFDLIVRTDPITATEMKAFVRGFFTAYNSRSKF